MTPTNSIPARTSLRLESGGGVSYSRVLAAPSALPGFSLLTRHKLSPASVGEPFHLHPGGVAVIRGSGPASPMRPNGVGVHLARLQASQRKANASGTPFVTDCLSTAPASSCPRRRGNWGV